MNKELLINRLLKIEELFDMMHNVNASSWQINKVESFRKDNPDCIEDLDFAFEILAGRHKVGFSFYNTKVVSDTLIYADSLEQLVDKLKYYTDDNKSDEQIRRMMISLLPDIRPFMTKLMNREYRLGYTNKHNMVTDKHCMLAKSYPKGVTKSAIYYIQEKLNGNRCIAYYDFNAEKWAYLSRSQKPLKVDFDMENFDKTLIYDGEIMRRGKMDNRDFATTSGLINSKYLNKSELVYFIYDILDSETPYYERADKLESMRDLPSNNVYILRTLSHMVVHPNPEHNPELDLILDQIVDKGGEGIILRLSDSPYYHSKHSGDRKNYLLKYKKVKTADLRIVDWNEGKGKYEGMIGSFVCEDDNGVVRVSVAGMTDDIRMSNPKQWIGKIIEVAYFEMSKSKANDYYSLQFPRIKRIRHDKNETSLF